MVWFFWQNLGTKRKKTGADKKNEDENSKLKEEVYDYLEFIYDKLRLTLKEAFYKFNEMKLAYPDVKQNGVAAQQTNNREENVQRQIYWRNRPQQADIISGERFDNYWGKKYLTFCRAENKESNESEKKDCLEYCKRILFKGLLLLRWKKVPQCYIALTKTYKRYTYLWGWTVEIKGDLRLQVYLLNDGVNQMLERLAYEQCGSTEIEEISGALFTIESIMADFKRLDVKEF